MTQPQITELLADLKKEADEQNVEIDESFVAQLLVLKREGEDRAADPETARQALGKLARTALIDASESGTARIGAGALIIAYSREDDPWKLKSGGSSGTPTGLGRAGS